MKRIVRWAAAVLSLAGTGAARAQEAGPTPLYHWVQAGAEGEWQLRAIYEAGTPCPAPATRRILPDSVAARFPVVVCQRTLDSVPLRLPRIARTVAAPSAVRRVVAIGDTGCREQSQPDCSAPQWPFAAVADSARRAGQDVTVHVGDYIYRENCGVTPRPDPCGDQWETWVADWFQPAGELLTAAPWVFARGNHEDCTRGGKGWFLFFDPRDVPSTGCAPATDPYAVAVPGLGKILILDSACAPSYSTCWPAPVPGKFANDTMVAVPEYARQMKAIADLAAGGVASWLVTHTPVWARDGTGFPDSLGTYILQSALRHDSLGGRLPASVSLSLAGHIHLWEKLEFAAPRTPVLVVGDGGTSESCTIPVAAPGTIIDGVAVTDFRRIWSFGYTLLDADGTGWRITPVEVAGSPCQSG
ncbi:MAG TPA: metallophosphoesterase [Longimicrobium sp.]|nr:metallophosphoesterase [Longimicrobium sp.]